MKVTIATPMYGGQCDGMYTSSMLKTQEYFAKKGHVLDYNFLFNESLIQRARNRLATSFLKGKTDYLLFIDADIGFEPEWIEDLVNSGKDLIAGVVPMKGLYLEYMSDAAKMGKKDIESYSGLFNYNPIPGSKPLLNTKEPYPVARVGTAFMLIKREVFEKMIPLVDSYETNKTYKEKVKEYSFFNVRVKDGMLMSEDFDFCERWREMGNEVYIAPWICTTHKGTYLFKGNLESHINLAKEKVLSRKDNL